MAGNVENRAKIVQRLRGHNGDGVVVQPGALKSARQGFVEAAQVFSEAQSRFVEAVHPRHYSVVVYGSTKLDERTPEGRFVSDLTNALVARTGCDIVTGGGPGIMEMAHQGAVRARKEAGKDSLIAKSRNHGATIVLPFEEEPSKNLDTHTVHESFPTRLAEFMGVANAIYVGPGGVGTGLELLTGLQEKQVHHVEDDFPLIVHPMWKPVLKAMDQAMYGNRVQEGKVPTITEGDVFNNVVFSDNISEIVDMIADHHAKWKTELRDHVVKAPNGNGSNGNGHR